MHVCVRERERESVCVREREKERVRESMYVCVYTSNKGLDNIAEIERKMEQKKREAQRAKQGDGGDEADDESESDSIFESERDDEGDGPQRGKKKKRSWGDVILDPNTYWLTFVPHERSLFLSLNTHTHTHTHTHTRTHTHTHVTLCYTMVTFSNLYDRPLNPVIGLV